MRCHLPQHVLRASLCSSKLQCAGADNTHCVCALRSAFVLLQLVIGDSPLNLNLQFMNVTGTFQMGTPSCPIQSLMNVFIPGGNSAWGITVTASGKYDVHAAFTVSARGTSAPGVCLADGSWSRGCAVPPAFSACSAGQQAWVFVGPQKQVLQCIPVRALLQDART